MHPAARAGRDSGLLVEQTLAGADCVTGPHHGVSPAPGRCSRPVCGRYPYSTCAVDLWPRHDMYDGLGHWGSWLGVAVDSSDGRARSGQDDPGASVLVDAAETISRLQQVLRDVLEQLVPQGGDVALLDFPNHNNSGDSAIWLGELRYLEDRGTRLRYVCDAATYDPGDLRRALPSDGVILLHGGGNFGDLWPLHHSFRLRVLRDFSDHRIVQLPQTIRVADETARWKPRIEEGGSYCVLCRDRRSLSLARTIPHSDVRLAPDMAFFLGELDRSRAPDRNIVWITRQDQERLYETPHQFGEQEVLVTDWLAVSGSSRAVRSMTVRTRGLVSSAARASQGRSQLVRLRRAVIAPHQLLAMRRLNHAVRLLSRGRAAVTDRLHGHILCLLLGIPHVLLEDNGGKIRGFVDAFGTQVGGVEFATSTEEALSRARDMVAA